jgi:hypothetical protein
MEKSGDNRDINRWIKQRVIEEYKLYKGKEENNE